MCQHARAEIASPNALHSINCRSLVRVRATGWTGGRHIRRLPVRPLFTAFVSHSKSKIESYACTLGSQLGLGSGCYKCGLTLRFRLLQLRAHLVQLLGPHSATICHLDHNWLDRRICELRLPLTATPSHHLQCNLHKMKCLMLASHLLKRNINRISRSRSRIHRRISAMSSSMYSVKVGRHTNITSELTQRRAIPRSNRLDLDRKN